MKNRWSDSEASNFIKTRGLSDNKDLALLAYATRLVGGIPALAMHGGGNTSCKGTFTSTAGDEMPALFIKPTGSDMAKVAPADFIALDLIPLQRLLSQRSLTDEAITAGFRENILGHSKLLPSIETPMHAFLKKKFIIHTHPSAVLALADRTDAQETVPEALGHKVGFIPYASLGLNLGHAVASEMTRKKDPPAIVLAQHGLVTWGETAREAYKKTIEFVSLAEEYSRKTKRFTAAVQCQASVNVAYKRYNNYAPLLSELLFPDAIILAPLISKEILDLLDNPKAREIYRTEPLNPDHLLRTKIRPIFVENPDYENEVSFRRQISEEAKSYSADYAAYIKRHSRQLKGLEPPASEFLPRVLLLPGMGAICAASTIEDADTYCDITRQSLDVKKTIYETGGTYKGLSGDDCFEMELRIWLKKGNTGLGPVSK
jgi:rhamnose utilization protein RhaD (predicted bifunctional aldolase and dehydrogenase)